jgi:hypothetical protein
MDWLIQHHGHEGQNGSSRKHLNQSLLAGGYYLRTAQRRIRRALTELWDNDDPFTTEVADMVLADQKPVG